MNTEQYIVIDGLDELPDRERIDMVQFLVSIVDKSNDHTPGKIRLLLISQDLADMRKLMKTSAEILDLKTSDTEDDVKVFVDKRLERLKDRFDLSEQQTLQIRLLVLRGTNGKRNSTFAGAN
ncbi:putative zinc finger protein [Phaeoacremonium minimum UCRPA7]|uniref:Putative zinc finger protein n=1 Tax=Phaeoacremonium minimum (strain UCR-PA7) TaxID=1286976 RepID=R8B8T5_PHAM7|nr:putative zinc finger protein [Phaeoacremonium minimum UCRPA7]EON95708.1 putative zinc finger protein [Phaeoacremonium minimum UCRPA7]